MDEAISTEMGGEPVGVGTALLGLRSGDVTDVHLFRCPDALCAAPVYLKAVSSATYEPHYASCSAARCLEREKIARAASDSSRTDQYHHPDCEYREGARRAGARAGGRIVLAGNALNLISGAQARVAGSLASASTGGPPASAATPRVASKKKSDFSLRAFIDYTRIWEPRDFAEQALSVEGVARRSSHLFIDAAWLSDFEDRRGAACWPRFLGPAKFFDAAKHAHVVFGSATLRGRPGDPLPTIFWDTTGERPVTTRSTQRSCSGRSSDVASRTISVASAGARTKRCGVSRSCSERADSTVSDRTDGSSSSRWVPSRTC